MAKSNWNFDRRDKNQLLEEIFDITTGHLHDGTDARALDYTASGLKTASFDTSTGHDHDGTDSKLLAYQTYKAGIASGNSATGATLDIAVAAMRATDAILASLIASGTTAYVQTVAQISTASFRVTMNTACGLCTVSYAVIRST